MAEQQSYQRMASTIEKSLRLMVREEQKPLELASTVSSRRTEYHTRSITGKPYQESVAARSQGNALSGKRRLSPPVPAVLPVEKPRSAMVHPPLAIHTHVRECPTCKMPVRDDASGFLRRPNHGPGPASTQEVPCPTCSPRVKCLKGVKKASQDLENVFGGVNLPGYAQSWGFDTYPTTGDQQVKAEVMAFAELRTAGRGLYLWGQLGHGKTSLAISALKAFLQRGVSGLYIRAPHFMRLSAGGIYNSEKQTAVLSLAYSVTCLVLDDLGVEQSSPAAIRQLYELVEERRGTPGRYTIITSNLSIEQLEEHWRPQGIASGAFHDGQRVTDRLRENWTELEIGGHYLRAPQTT